MDVIWGMVLNISWILVQNTQNVIEFNHYYNKFQTKNKAKNKRNNRYQNLIDAFVKKNIISNAFGKLEIFRAYWENTIFLNVAH